MIDTMNIKTESNFRLSVASIQYISIGELCICLISDGFSLDIRRLRQHSDFG